MTGFEAPGSAGSWGTLTTRDDDGIIQSVVRPSCGLRLYLRHAVTRTNTYPTQVERYCPKVIDDRSKYTVSLATGIVYQFAKSSATKHSERAFNSTSDSDAISFQNTVKALKMVNDLHDKYISPEGITNWYKTDAEQDKNFLAQNTFKSAKKAFHRLWYRFQSDRERKFSWHASSKNEKNRSITKKTLRSTALEVLNRNVCVEDCFLVP